MALEIPELKEYGAVREAYERARILLNAENPDRRELAGILDAFDSNPEGKKLLELEVGTEFPAIYKKVAYAKEAANPVDFGNTRIPRYELDALEKILLPVAKKPETFYAENNEGRIKIYGRHVVSLIFEGFKLNAIAPEIGSLSELKFAMFASNSLGTLPKEIGRNKKLETLGLQYNPIRHLPIELESLPLLSSISISRYRSMSDFETEKMLERMYKKGVKVFQY